MRRFCIYVVSIILISFCLCELSVEKKDKFLNGFVDYLNNLPNQAYAYEDGVLISAQETEDDSSKFEIVTKLKVSEVHNVDAVKFLQCNGSLIEGPSDEDIRVQDDYHCVELSDENPLQFYGELDEVVTDNPNVSTEAVERRPVQLDNEVQPNIGLTSGEQFIAIPREQPAPCIGCASHVSTQAAGVTELAELGVRHLDRHDPTVRHTLNTVHDVERQVQVVNGVRYIVTLTVDYNNCTSTKTEACSFTVPCKISILEKPWMKLPDGSKYRAIVANNCTEEWQFGDNGEVLPQNSDNNKESNEINVNPNNTNDNADDGQKTQPDYNKIASTGSVDDVVKVIQSTDLETQQNQQRTLTDEEIKNLQEQIIPHNQFNEPPKNEEEKCFMNCEEKPQETNVNAEHVEKVETKKRFSDNSVPVKKQEIKDTTGSLTDDKKKLIDDMMNFFDFAGFDSNTGETEQNQRMKRSYKYDLKVMNLAEKYHKLKKNMYSAKYLYTLGQTMVDYLNEMDMEIKSRTLEDIIAAEEEFENHQHFFYIQARVTIPCDKAECNKKDTENKICNGVIDNSNPQSPQVLNTFCHTEEKKKVKFGSINKIPSNDNILLLLAKEAVKKIETESPYLYAMRVNKILHASTQRVSGTLTKMSLMLEYINCSKSVPHVLRNNCTLVEHIGSEICEVEIHERHWLKDKKIAYSCTQRPADGSFVYKKQHEGKVQNISDPKVIEIAQEALQYLEIQSNRNNKQKIVEIKTVSTQIVGGLLTNVEFVVGYTECKHDFEDDVNTCKLLEKEQLRQCKAQVWNRPWLEDGRQVKVSCDDSENNAENNSYLKLRKKRSEDLHFVGGPLKQDTYNAKYQTLAEESLQKYLQTSGNMQYHKVIKIEKVTTQVVAGSLTEIDFKISPTDCQMDAVGQRSSSNCEVSNSADVFSCHSSVWERPWLNKKDITVNCTDNNAKSRAKRQLLGGQTEQNSKDPKYMELAEESLRQYLETSGVTQHHKVIRVVKVTTQVVSGTVTQIDFRISPTNCQLDSKRQMSSSECEVPSLDEVYRCHAKVWEQLWLNKKRIDVNCKVDSQKSRVKRQVKGGEKEKDPNDSKYRSLAEECLLKYLKTSDNIQHHKVVQVDKVVTQVVAGSLTKIDFKVSPTNCQLDSNGQTSSSNCEVINSADVFNCHSEVWEQLWLKKKEINVNCTLDSQKSRVRRQVPGGEKEKDPNDSKYRSLAEECLLKYLKTSDNIQHHKVVQVDKVVTQVVAGSLTKIDFKVSPTNCQLDSNGQTSSSNCEVKNSADVFNCHSEVWEQLWLKKKEINVNCTLDSQKSRVRRQVPGGEKEKDPNDSKYRSLAEECLLKYLKTSDNIQHHKVVQVDKVVTQVVAGSLTKIDFKVSPTNCQLDSNGQTSSSNCDVKNSADVFSCYSEVWEQPWLKKKEITVNCTLDSQKSRVTRQVPGGETSQDPNDARYRVLAKQCLQQYLQTSGNIQHHDVVQVNQVVTQVVAGSLTKIDFTISPTNCQIDSNGHTSSSNCEVKSSAEVFNCHSEVWERSWLNKTEITVNCTLSDQTTRSKRYAVAGEVTKEDANDEKFKILAEESLHKYMLKTESKRFHKLVEVESVRTQIISGKLTRLDFKISPTNCEIDDMSKNFLTDCEIVTAEVFHCRSEVWERPWLKGDSKVIDVTCNNINGETPKDVDGLEDIKTNEVDTFSPVENSRRKRSRSRAVSSGGGREQDPTKSEYRKLAEESLHKYVRSQKSQVYHEVVEVKHVVTRVVQGMHYTMDYIASPTLCAINALDKAFCERNDTVLLYCHTEIWNRPWLKRREIKVACNSYGTEEGESFEDSNKERKKRSLGGPQEIDVNSEESKQLAEQVLRKYQRQTNSVYKYKVNKIHHVEKRVVSGIVRNIDLTISQTSCIQSEGRNGKGHCELQKPKVTLRCHATVQDLAVPSSVPDIRVRCRNKQKKKKVDTTRQKRNEIVAVRDKRQTGGDDDYLEDETKYYYADRAISQFNRRADTNNLYKIISIHDAQRSVHMNTVMVRMYMEIAMTYCMRDGEEHELHNCDEIDGINHKLCLARVWPSPDDEIVVQQTSMVCDDDEQFERISGLSTMQLLKASIAEIEKSPSIHYKIVHQGEPNIVPSLDYRIPTRLSFVVASTNCTKDFDVDRHPFECFVDSTRPAKICTSYIYMLPNSKSVHHIDASCKRPKESRKRRSIALDSTNATADDLIIQKMVQESLEKLEMASIHRYKQRVLLINSYSTKITTGKQTTIDFDVGYTNCLKYEWVENVTSCEFIEHLPRRHCVSHVFERLWVENGRLIEVSCEDDETPLEAHIEFESAENAMQLAREALKHIEAKYPHPRKQKVVRIFSLEKQAIAGLHYRLKMEVGFTDCMALSIDDNCKFVTSLGLNRFCRVNVWLRPWTDHPPSYRVNCDYQEGAAAEVYHQIQAEALFYDFMTTYKPDYMNDHTQTKERFEIFRANVRKIHELNIYERGTARYAVTRFSDLSREEFSARFLGLKPSLQVANQVPMRMAEIPKVQLPDKFDWRDFDAVTEVKDQGSCGSCWAFSVTGNIEGQWKMQSGKLVSLSEQELVDCDKLDQGCNGGLPDNAYRAIEQLGGLELESDYPYEGADDKCSFNRSLSRVQISGAVNITSNETAMAQWLVQNGPISIGINANAMQFYVGGVSHPWKMLCSPNNLDHGVLIVGYGVKDYPLFHKRLPYWIVKNSWGKSWGEQGYYRVYRGDGTCGLNQMASSAVV